MSNSRLQPRASRREVLALHLKDVDRSCVTEGCRQFVAPGADDMTYSELLPRLHWLTDAIGYVEVDDPENGHLAAATGAETFLRATGFMRTAKTGSVNKNPAFPLVQFR